jgi:hypothetical protein
MKKYHIDMSKGATANVDIIPPPSFTQGDIPFQYMYASHFFKNSGTCANLPPSQGTAKTQQSNKPSANPAKSSQ